jgi:two-component system chemotaxis sensor kinase CheA
MLCQRLEEVLAAARDRAYRVHEDVDIVVTMAIQFIGMLLRRKPGIGGGGIDLEGFLQQMQATVNEWLRRSSEVPPADTAAPVRAVRFASSVVTGPTTRERLASLATAVYLEHLRAAGAARGRLRDVYAGMVRVVDDLSAIPIAPFVAKHAAAATELARELGKEVEARVDVGDVCVHQAVLDVVNVVVLHILRNAVDHGIEPPHARGDKNSAATVRLTARTRGDRVELRIEDDGSGIDLEAVRSRAIEKGLLARNAEVTNAELVQLVFRPGLSTRREPSAISGRGVGLDAVKAEVDRVGGSIVVTTERGKGTAFVVRLPKAVDRLDVHRFRAARARIPIVVDTEWSCAVTLGEARCVTELLDLPAEEDPSGSTVIELRRASARFKVLALGAPQPVTAIRRCPTAVDAPVEIVDVGGEEALLVRPAVLMG